MATVRMAGGREITIPSNNGQVDARSLRRILGVSRGRALIRQTSSGQNYVIPTRGTVEVDPYDYFLETARAKRGIRNE